LLVGCSKKLEDTPAYQAACEGPPLGTVERRNQAMEDGYDINRQYDCIDKQSFAAVKKQRAEWAAANTPEAKAKRTAELAEQRQRDAEQRLREAEAGNNTPAEALPTIVLRNVDVNTATEAEIAAVISIDAETAARIVAERDKRRFNDWNDLIARVTGLSAAQPAVAASICGLNVNGKSLDGAPPDAAMAASIYKKYQRYQKR
jgi:hypothetical protein